MERGTKRATVAVVAQNSITERRKRPFPNPSAARRPPPPGGYFSAESFLVLLCLTASLVVLPLVLPPLPPPPFLLLLVPIGILAVLLVLALMPSDVRDVPSPYFNRYVTQLQKQFGAEMGRRWAVGAGAYLGAGLS